MRSRSGGGAASEGCAQKVPSANAHDGGDRSAAALPVLRAGPSLLLWRSLRLVEPRKRPGGPWSGYRQPRAACRRAPATEQRGLRAFHVIV